MAIDVVCTGCKTRFQVSEKFAGKKGPCPKCKTVITIPAKNEEVVIHAPEPSGPVDSTGKAVLEPIFREEVRVTTPMIVGIVASIVVVLLMALVLRLNAPKPGQIAPVLTILGAIVLAPPLALAGYTFLRDDELAPHRGMTLVLRLIAPSIVYPLLWGLYWVVFAYLDIKPEMLAMVVVLPAMIAIGAFTAQMSLDLEFGQGALHYALYLAATVLLRLLMGMHPYWNV
jgi:hypothetical protein